MRTLKRSLCLVLAVVMILGLGAFNVSALSTKDYIDSKDITHTEAVDVLGAIGVLEGDDDDGDGKTEYRGNDTLTREQATKIVTMLFGVTAVSAKAPFADVDESHAWANDFIAYCAEQGIIEGVDDENNLFDPSGTLTGGAFAKMLLVALGYDAALEGMAGTESWLINVAKLVRNNNLDYGIDNFPYDEAINRDDAAQLAFNVLTAALVTYDNKGSAIVVNGVTISSTPGGAKYMTTMNRDTQTISYAKVNDGTANGTYIVEFAEKYQPKLRRDTANVDKFGRPCTTWTFNRVEIGTYTDPKLKVAEWNGKFKNQDAYKILGSDLMRRINQVWNGNEEYWFDVYVNGVEQDFATEYGTYFFNWNKNNDKDFDESGAGRTVELYVDENVANGLENVTQVTVVVIDTWLAKVSSPKNNKGEARISVYGQPGSEMNGPTITVKEEDIPNIGDYKEDEYVLVQVSEPTDNNKRAIRTIAAAQVLTNQSASAYSTDTRKVYDDIYGNHNANTTMMDSITVAGTKYNVAYKAMWNTSVLNSYGLEKLKDNTYDLYLDQFGNVIGIDSNNDNSNYVFVTQLQLSNSTDYFGTSDTFYATLIYTDGNIETKATVKLSDNALASAKPYFDMVRVVGTSVPITGINNVTWADALAGAQSMNGAGRAWGPGSKKDQGATINRWFTCTVDKDNKVTLHDLVGYQNGSVSSGALSGDGKVAQAAYTNTEDVSSTNRGLFVGTANSNKGGTYAYGNDASVYIPVKIEQKDVGGMITEVGTVTKGIANTSIKPYKFDKDTNGTGYSNFALYKYDSSNGCEGKAYGNKNSSYQWTFDTYSSKVKTDQQGNNTFFIYDVKSMTVKYAVVIAASNAKDVLYITSNGPTSSIYNSSVGYVDTYDAIFKGEKTEIRVDRSKSKTAGANEKLVPGLYAYAESDGFITTADEKVTLAQAYNDADGTYPNMDNNKNERYAFARPLISELSVEGNTIVSTTSRADEADDNGYIYTNGNTRFYVADGPTGARSYDEYGSAASARSAAATNLDGITATEAFVNLFAICDGDTGIANTVVFVTNGAGTSSGSGWSYATLTTKNASTYKISVDTSVGFTVIDGTSDTIYMVSDDATTGYFTVTNKSDVPVYVKITANKATNGVEGDSVTISQNFVYLLPNSTGTLIKLSKMPTVSPSGMTATDAVSYSKVGGTITAGSGNYYDAIWGASGTALPTGAYTAITVEVMPQG